MAANLLEQVGQQLQELENQLAAARAHNEFLQQELAGKVSTTTSTCKHGGRQH